NDGVIRGGYGIALGVDKIGFKATDPSFPLSSRLNSNVSLFGRLNGHFDSAGSIELLSCYVADNGPPSATRFPYGDGFRLCGEIAAYSGVVVIASDGNVDVPVKNKSLYLDEVRFDGNRWMFWPTGESKRI